MYLDQEEVFGAAEGLFAFIREGTSPFHVVEAGVSMLRLAGFSELDYLEDWKVERGGKYFVKMYGKSLFAFTVGSSLLEDKADFHIAAAHTDYPCLHIKPKAEYETGGYQRINTEVYGAPILSTWLDRPLSMSGRIAVRGGSMYSPKLQLLDMKKPLFTIPNLAVHMNREVNQGVAYKKQSDMLPLFSAQAGEDKEYFLQCLAQEASIHAKDILDFDLYVYVKEEPVYLGKEDAFVSSPRIDNLSSCYALLKGLISGTRPEGINLTALYDNEEVGSRTKQGADSQLLNLIIEKLCASLSMDKIQQNTAVMKGFLFSVDVAHALHPAHLDKYDTVNKSLLNDGVVLKINSNQKYTFDTEAVAVAQQLCEYAEIPYKKFVNHSDMPGGGTLGPIISSYLPMRTVDIGIPILAMHSARELMGVLDQYRLERLMHVFFDVLS